MVYPMREDKMTHLFTKYNHLTNDELISIAENLDDEMVLELVGRLNRVLNELDNVDDECSNCGQWK